MKLEITKGTTSKRLAIYVRNITTGLGLTGLVFNSAGLTWRYWRENEGDANSTSVTIVTATRGTFTSGGFIEKDAANMPGWYEIGAPDAALASDAAANWVCMLLQGAANMEPVAIEIQLTTFNFDTGVVASVAGAVGSVTGAVGSVTGAVGSVTGAVGSVTGNLGGNVLGNVVGSVGSVLGNVAGSVASVVGNLGGNVLGNVVGSIGSLAAAAVAQVLAEAAAALAAVNLDHWVGTAAGIPAIPAGTYFDQATRKAAGTYDRETDSQEAIGDAVGGPSPGLPAAVWAYDTDTANQADPPNVAWRLLRGAKQWAERAFYWRPGGSP